MKKRIIAKKEGIKNYFTSHFKDDLIAGTVVCLVALPLAIAFSVASGASPEQGIYTAIIAGFIMALFSGSNFQVSGPTGAFVVVLLGIVNDFGLPSLLIAGFMAGVILLILGIFRFGSVIKFIPYPVIVGFTAGIGVIIFSGQLKDFMGLGACHFSFLASKMLPLIAENAPRSLAKSMEASME